MSTSSHPWNPAQLAAQNAWMRRLARRLLIDPADAEDVVQETWAAALARPDAPVSSRSWVATVLLNFVRKRARGDGRRLDRERRVFDDSREVLAPSADELLARHEVQRVVAELVSGLESPYRETVLLRYAEGLEPSDIARSQGLPAGTVRWRLNEAHARLRKRLEARLGKQGSVWRLLLLLPPQGGLLVKASTKNMLAVALSSLLLIGGIEVWRTRDKRSSYLVARAGQTGEIDDIRQLRVQPLARPESGSPSGKPLLPRFVAVAPSDARTGVGAEGGGSAQRPGPNRAIPADRRYDLTREELEKLARNCELRVDVPGMRTAPSGMFLGWLTEADLEAQGLTAMERTVVSAALGRYRGAVNDEFRRFYVELTGDAEGAALLDLHDMQQDENPRRLRLESVVTVEQFQRGAGQVAHELAGLKEPPLVSRDDPFAAFYRIQRRLADRFEQDLASRLPPERARHIRRINVSGHTGSIPGCP